MRTRSFRARNERVERGAATKSQKGRKDSVDHGRKGTHAVSVMMDHLETDAIRDKKRQSSSLAPKAQTQTDEKIPSKVQEAEERAPLEPEERFRAEISPGESVRIRHVICGTLP